jgi:hypothetical protein
VYPSISEDSAGCACGLVEQRRSNNEHVHNEPGFRYFLDVERHLARRSGRALLLVLVHANPRHVGPRREPRIAASVAVRLFRGLGACTRDIDLIGWYRSERVAAALLTPNIVEGTDFVQLLRRRLDVAMRAQLPAESLAMIHTHVRILSGR